jgi:multidrug efflux pump subunit AcrA (membrane-fusion protein)
MTLRLFADLIKWPVALALLGGALTVAYLVHSAKQKEREQEALTAPKLADNPGELTLKSDLAESLLLEVEPAKAEEGWHEPVTVYGRVVPNPLATSEIRATFAGTLRQGDTAWPAPGTWVRTGQVIGRLDIRLGPQERLDLQARLSEAQLRQQGAEKVLHIQRERVDRLKPSSGSEVIAQGELDEALVKVEETKTQLATSREAVRLWEEALTEIDRQGGRPHPTWSHPLVAPAEGEVAELASRPGMAMEAGGLVLRLVDFRRPLVRLDLPPEALQNGPPTTVDLLAIVTPPPALRGARNQPRPESPPRLSRASLQGIAPQVDPASQFAGYFYEIPTAPGSPGDGVAWRPGLAVKAELPLQPPPSVPALDAVSVPATALLYHQGRALVYVLRSRDKKTMRFARREVQVLGRKGDRWVLAANEALAAEDQVVVSGAQVLLSQEFIGALDND